MGKGTCVCVLNPKGQHFRTTGFADRWNRTWLLPEEALYLLERGSLDIRWPADPSEEERGEVEGGIPMSLQGAYSCFIGREGLTMERYTVYSGLRRGGYALLRAESWDETSSNGDGESSESEVAGREVAPKDGFRIVSFMVRLFKSICADSTRSTALGPLVGLGIHKSYSKSIHFLHISAFNTNYFLQDDIYRSLSLSSHHTPDTTAPSPSSPPKTTPPFRIAYNVYKPATPFRKSSPPTPDFRIAVVSTVSQPTIPTLCQLSALLESTPLDPPKGEKMDRLLYMRLKHGWRNVILAVVDQGVVSFLRVADARFGGERLYEARSAGVRNKGARRGGGANRGRGRGGGGRGRGRGR